MIPQNHNVRFKWLGKMQEHDLLLLLSLVVGLCSGGAAVLLNYIIGLIKKGVDLISAGGTFNWQYLVFPGIGMMLAFLLVKYAVRDNIGHGVTKVLYAVSRNESRIKPHNMWSSLAASSLTIGLGGSVGAEAPIVFTGAAIGSNVARAFGLSYKNMTVLLGCGAAGAIAGIFKAPLAGVLFTLEILMFNVSLSTMAPLLLSTVSAAVVAYIFNGVTPAFVCSLTPLSMSNIPFYIILGILCAAGSLYFMRTTLWMEDKLGAMKNPYQRWGICALGLGALIFVFPMLYGEGYAFLGDLLNGNEVSVSGRSVLISLLDSRWGAPLLFLLVFLTKVVAMTLTNAGGGVGGTFGPTLFEGAILGFVTARVLNLIGAAVPEQNFVLVGMAGLMAGVMQAPMTAIFLIAEISGGYELFLPLIITSTVSFGLFRLFERYSIYSKRIAQSGDLLTHDNDKAVLTLLKTADLVRDKYPRVGPDDTLGDLVKVLADSTAAVFAVVDSENRFQGLVDVDVVRRYILRRDLYSKMHVYNFMNSDVDCVNINDKMEAVMARFENTETWRLPVTDSEKHYLGFISKSRILMAYREELKAISSED